jgi:hypothetical protein
MLVGVLSVPRYILETPPVQSLSTIIIRIRSRRGIKHRPHVNNKPLCLEFRQPNPIG